MALQITPLPPAPQRTDAPADFVTKADAHVASLDGFVTETNALATEAEGNATDAEASNVASGVSETNAAASAASADASASLAVASANLKGNWSALAGALNKPASVVHDGTFWGLLNDLADVTASEPGVTADWASIPQPVKVNPRTAADPLTADLPNELQDGSAFPVPLANSLPANTSIEIEQPEAFKAFKPSVVRSGANLFRDGNGTDTVILFVNPTKIKLTTNGVDEWRL